MTCDGAGRLRFAANIYDHMLSLNVAPSIQTYNTLIRLIPCSDSVKVLYY